MVHFNRAVEICAPPDRIWEVLQDIERWPDWTATVTRVESLDRGPLAIGNRARIRQPRLPDAEWRVTELEAGRGFTWITQSPGVKVTARHWVEANENGSQVTLSLHFSGMLGPLVGLLTRGLNVRYLAIEAKGLKACCEDQVKAAYGDNYARLSQI